MANRQTRARIAAIRKAKDHFHGKACNSSDKLTPKGVRKDKRDASGKLRQLSEKRVLDRRITGSWLEVFV
jgi:hypothetical protein